MGTLGDRMKPLIAAAAAALLLASAGVAWAQTEPPVARYRFQEVAPGVFASIWSGGGVGPRSTSAVIVNDEDVLLVDTQVTPARTRALIEDLRTITDKPVRYVVNTHWHYDHTGGNQVFGPEVQIIAHENTGRAIAGGVLKRRVETEITTNLPPRIAALEKQVADAPDAGRKAELQAQIRALGDYIGELKETTPTAPGVTLATGRLILQRGGREIQIIDLGRGHTDTDLIVYLPKEKVVATGDMFEGPVTGALQFGFYPEWVEALERLRAIDFETVIPGHGGPFTGKAYIDHFEALLRDLWRQGGALHAAGVPAAEAAKRIDLTAHSPHFRAITGPGVAEIIAARLYAVIDMRARAP
jgi:cyclase